MSQAITRVIVQGTFGLLAVASVFTWALILIKGRQRWLNVVQNRRFFRNAGSPPRLSVVKTLQDHEGPAWRVSRVASEVAGREETVHPSNRLEAVEKALESQIGRERRASEAGLGVLASVGSTAPFVGLFGTVFGIISALRAIGSAGSASLEVVAGPIGEALVATGVGIAVAVPATLAYNYFVRGIKAQAWELEQLGLALLWGGTQDVHHPELRVERGRTDTPREASV